MQHIAAKCVQRPFHGDNTGSNPVGDANKTNNLDVPAVFPGPPRDHLPIGSFRSPFVPMDGALFLLLVEPRLGRILECVCRLAQALGKALERIAEKSDTATAKSRPFVSRRTGTSAMNSLKLRPARSTPIPKYERNRPTAPPKNAITTPSLIS